ncbi:MAG: hypothetical protein ACJ788_10940 [Ktedonobacteraceae bacterium]
MKRSGLSIGIGGRGQPFSKTTSRSAIVARRASLVFGVACAGYMRRQAIIAGTGTILGGVYRTA